LFLCSARSVIKVGDDLCHCLFGYGVGEFCSTTFKNVFKRAAVLGRASVSKQLDGHGRNRQQEGGQDCGEAKHFRRQKNWTRLASK
jgi:hypothetical protein